MPQLPKKSRSKRKSSRGTATGMRDWIGGIQSFLAADLSRVGMIAAAVLYIGYALALWMNPQPMAPLMGIVTMVGGLAMLAGSLGLLMDTFRVSVGWGLFFLMTCVVSVGLAATGSPVVFAGWEILRCLIFLMFLIDNWEACKFATLVFLAGLLMVTAPLWSMIGMLQEGQEGQIANQSPWLKDARPDELFRVSEVPLPEFPDLGPFQRQAARGYEYQKLTFMDSKTPLDGKNAPLAGTRMRVCLFQPSGEFTPNSLPCVLVNGAGTNLLHGSGCPEPDHDAETWPYVQAGFAVLGFSTDGESRESKTAKDRGLTLAYEEFRNSCAGMVNVRNAVEFLIRKVPQVDRNRIFIAGHSSAGTLALLAAHEPRLKGCIAYAPVSDVERRLNEGVSSWVGSLIFVEMSKFSKQSSPLTHAARITCPLFLFHAEDDSNVPVDDSRRFAAAMTHPASHAQLMTVERGDHYDSMILAGIPQAVVWLRKQAGIVDSNAAPSNRPPNSFNPSIAVAQENTPAARFVSPTPSTVPINNPPRTSNPTTSPPTVAASKPNIVATVSDRVLVFRVRRFNGEGNPAAAAREALDGITSLNLNDIVIDQASSELRIGAFPGALKTDEAKRSLENVGFQFQSEAVVRPKQVSRPTSGF